MATHDESEPRKEGVEKDSRMVIADVIEGSKKALDQVPGKQRIEKEIASRMQAIPAAFDLPSKKDIEALLRQVKTLNTKVNKPGRTSQLSSLSSRSPLE